MKAWKCNCFAKGGRLHQQVAKLKKIFPEKKLFKLTTIDAKNSLMQSKYFFRQKVFQDAQCGIFDRYVPAKKVEKFCPPLSQSKFFMVLAFYHLKRLDRLPSYHTVVENTKDLLFYTEGPFLAVIMFANLRTPNWKWWGLFIVTSSI